MAKQMRTPARDVELVREFLEEFPHPHIYSIEAYEPGEQNEAEWEGFLDEPWEHKFKIFRLAGNANIEGLPRVALRDLTIKYVGEPIELDECTVAAISANRPIAEWLRYKCLTCGEDKFPQIPNQLSSSQRPKMKCCDNQILVEVFDKRDMVDAQWVRLQEVKRDSKVSKIPLNIPALMKGEDMLWTVSFNERIRPKGLLRFRVTKSKTDGTKQYIPWFEIFAFTRVKAEEMEDISTLTEADIKTIESEMQKPGFFTKLKKSFAPHIYGMEILKEAALLTLGSVRHTRPVRVLVVGDPSLAKSMVMEYASMLLSGSFYVVMSDARKTGLTTTSVQDQATGEWMVEPGVFAMADGSAMFIDEFQQGRAEDIGGLNHVIERGKIQYSLAGGNHGEFDALCAIMISCNAHTGMIGSEENIYELLKFVGNNVPAFVGRMHLVLFLRDEKTQEEEEEVAGRIYDHSEADPLAKYKDNWPDPVAKEETTIDIPFLKGLKMTFSIPEERFGTTMLRKILRYIIEYVPINPMPPEFRDSFIKYYMDKRADVVERHNKLITPRFMRHVVNLTQVYARLHGRSQATRSDMEHVFELMLRHMAVVTPIDPETGEYDVNIFNASLPKQVIALEEAKEVGRMSKQQQWIYACKKAMKDSDDVDEQGQRWFTEQHLVNVLGALPKSKWTYGPLISEQLEKAQEAGKMMVNKDRKYTWVE